MPDVTKVKKITEKWETKFSELKMSDDMIRAVMDYLEEVGALTYCGTTSGCNGPCPSGYGCTQLSTGNCICVKG